MKKYKQLSLSQRYSIQCLLKAGYTQTQLAKTIGQPHYNTTGGLIRIFIIQVIVLSPLATVNHIIEKENMESGYGANFK